MSGRAKRRSQPRSETELEARWKKREAARFSPRFRRVHFGNRGEIVELIPRYDENFFNCYMGHLVSYAKHCGVPVEMAFCKCFETTQRIYHSFFVLDRDRWHFRNHFIYLAYVGVQATEVRHATFEEAKPDIMRQIDAGRIVFMPGDGYYVPHRHTTYQKMFQAHNFMLSAYRIDHGECRWFMQDHAQPDFYDYYDEAIVADAYNRADYPFAHSFTYFTWDEEKSARPDLAFLRGQFNEYFHMYVDDFSLFGNVLDMLKRYEHHRDPIPGGMERVLQAFLFLASSRELFRRYLTAVDMHLELEGLLKESISLAFSVRGRILRGISANRMPMAQMESLLLQLKEVEEKLLHDIRALKTE